MRTKHFFKIKKIIHDSFEAIIWPKISFLEKVNFNHFLLE